MLQHVWSCITKIKVIILAKCQMLVWCLIHVKTVAFFEVPSFYIIILLFSTCQVCSSLNIHWKSSLLVVFGYLMEYQLSQCPSPSYLIFIIVEIVLFWHFVSSEHCFVPVIKQIGIISFTTTLYLLLKVSMELVFPFLELFSHNAEGLSGISCFNNFSLHAFWENH